MFQYHMWATNKLLTYLKELNEEVFIRNIQSVFPSISAVFEHLYTVENMFLARMKDKEGSLEVKEFFSSVSDAIEKFQILHRNMNLFFTQNENSLSESFTYLNSKGESFQNSFQEVVSHLVNHGTYHRGNITAMLWQMGEKGVSTDYIFYLRDKGHN